MRTLFSYFILYRGLNPRDPRDSRLSARLRAESRGQAGAGQVRPIRSGRGRPVLNRPRETGKPLGAEGKIFRRRAKNLPAQSENSPS